MKNAAKTVLLIGGLGATAYFLSGLGKAAATGYAIDISDINLESVQPWKIENVSGVPNIKSKVVLSVANPSLYDLNLTYTYLEMFFGKIKFGTIRDSTSRSIAANDSRYLLEFWGLSSIIPMITNGLIGALLLGDMPEDIRIKGYLRVNGNLIQVDFTKPFKIPTDLIAQVKERLRDLFPSKNW
jgi:hypothetical protein